MFEETTIVAGNLTIRTDVPVLLELSHLQFVTVRLQSRDTSKLEALNPSEISGVCLLDLHDNHTRLACTSLRCLCRYEERTLQAISFGAYQPRAVGDYLRSRFADAPV